MDPPMYPPMEKLPEDLQRKMQQIARDLLKELEKFVQNLTLAEKTAVIALLELNKEARGGAKKKRVVKKKN